MIKDRIIKIIEHYFGNGRGSITRFAEKLKIKTGLVGNWLSGSVDPSAKYRRMICDTFGVSQTWLDTGEGEMLAKPISGMTDSVILSEREIGRIEGELKTLREQINRYENRLDKYDGEILAALKACSEIKAMELRK